MERGKDYFNALASLTLLAFWKKGREDDFFLKGGFDERGFRIPLLNFKATQSAFKKIGKTKMNNRYHFIECVYCGVVLERTKSAKRPSCPDCKLKRQREANQKKENLVPAE